MTQFLASDKPEGAVDTLSYISSVLRNLLHGVRLKMKFQNHRVGNLLFLHSRISMVMHSWYTVFVLYPTKEKGTIIKTHNSQF